MDDGITNAKSAEPTAFNDALVEALPRLKVCAVYLTKDAVSRTQDISIPDDLLQQTCLRALSRTHQFHGENVFAWTYKIMRSIWFSELRSQKRRSTDAYQDENQVDDQFEKAVLAKLMISDIRRVCSYVSDGDFDLVVRFHSLGQTYDEIAEDLGDSLWSVRFRISKTKEKIIKRMREIAKERKKKDAFRHESR